MRVCTSYRLVVAQDPVGYAEDTSFTPSPFGRLADSPTPLARWDETEPSVLNAGEIAAELVDLGFTYSSASAGLADRAGLV